MNDIKTKLINYRSICSELSEIEEELRAEEVTIAVQSSSSAPYSLHTVTMNGLPGSQKVNSLLEKQADLRASKCEIEQFVDSIEDYEIRRIILMRYIRGKRKRSWQYIAMQLGYCADHTPKRKLKKFFEKNF